MYRIYIKTKQNLLTVFEPFVEPHVETLSFVEIEDPNALWDSEDWYMEGFSNAPIPKDIIQNLIEEMCKEDGLPVPEIEVAPFTDQNWLEEMWKAFPPQEVGPFFIHGDGYSEAVPPQKIAINLHAATAFGSGEHGTTAGCMLAIYEAYVEHPWKAPLDLGCGSGILAIAMAKLHPIPTHAIDNDPESVRVAIENARKNGVSELILARTGEGLDHVREKFDLIVANILAKPLIFLAPQMKEHLLPQGRVILSGLLDWQEDEVLSAYLNEGFTLKNKKNINRWITLILSL